MPSRKNFPGRMEARRRRASNRQNSTFRSKQNLPTLWGILRGFIRFFDSFFPICAYALVSLVIVVSAAVNAGIGPAAYAITTSSLFLTAGGGLKASLWWGDKAQKVGGSVVALLIVALAQSLSNGFSVNLFGYALSGAAWGWIGFIVCFIFATRKLAGTSVPAATASVSLAALLDALGELMERHPTALMGTIRLPRSKVLMKDVIKVVARETPNLRRQLMHAYLYLSHFQDGIGDAVFDSKLPDIKRRADGTPNPEAAMQMAQEIANGPKGENFRQWTGWSKVSLAEMEILSHEWRAFERQI